MSADTKVPTKRDLIDEIRRGLGSDRFRFINLADAKFLYGIPTGWSGWVCVIGHPEWGAYEWVAREDAEFHGDTKAKYQNSDCGYGSPEAAMRDGLVKMLD